MYYNVHTHIFNIAETPEYFLSCVTKVDRKPAKWVRSYLNFVKATGQKKWMLKPVLWIPGAKRYKAFFEIGIHKGQEEVFEELLSNYDAPFRFVALPLVFEHMGGGECEVSYKQQMKELLELAQTDKYKNILLPFYPVDPRSFTSGDELRTELEEYMKKGCVGLKFYPSLGFYPFDQRLQQLYEFAATHQVPIMTHCSRGGPYYGDDIDKTEFLNPQSFNKQAKTVLSLDAPTDRKYKFEVPKVGDYPKSERVNNLFCDNFLDPENYVDALDKYPNLKICLAHFGADDEYCNHSKGAGSCNMDYKLEFNENWYDKTRNAILKYPNVYADISYTLHIPAFLEEIIKDMTDTAYNSGPIKFADKILFGTDFFMTVQEEGGTDRELLKQAQDKFSKVPGLFDKIAIENPRRYLTSDFYIAP
jgi:predicted TIM-barrel fold metal-dependent hydrolase